MVYLNNYIYYTYRPLENYVTVVQHVILKIFFHYKIDVIV